MIDPVTRGRQFARQNRKLTLQKVAEAEPRRVDIFAVAIDKVHRHIEHVLGIALVPEPVFEHEAEHPGAGRVGVGPDVAAVGEVAVGLALGKRRIGEQRGCERLQRQRGTEFFHHVGLARIVEVDLNGAGPQHHVEAHGADAGHMPQHDFVAALGHDRQFVAGLVRPHSEAQKTLAGLGPDRLDLIEVPPGFGAGLVQVFQRRARQFQLPGRFQTDRAVAARQRDNVAAFDHRLPAVVLKRFEQIADPALFSIAGGVVIGGAIDQFLVFGPDPPSLTRLFALGHRGDQLVAAFDHRIVAI